MEVRNIKLSAKIQFCPLDIVTKRLTEKNVPYKKFGNFISFRKKFSFVVFKPSKDNLTHVNITRVPNFNGHVTKSLKILTKLLNRKILSSMVDNIIATTDLKKKVLLNDIIKNKSINYMYNSERFPGLFIKFNWGTSIVYHSGKIVIVGCKTIENLHKIREWLLANI